VIIRLLLPTADPFVLSDVSVAAGRWRRNAADISGNTAKILDKRSARHPLPSVASALGLYLTAIARTHRHSASESKKIWDVTPEC
jgi:hypothetical protein